MRLDERMTVTKKVQSNPTIALSCKSGYPENSRCQSDKILSELSIGRSVGGPDIVAECHECRCGWFIAFDHEDLMYKHRDD
ncbi:MAG: hypothetical protein HY225_03330 [Candidatus Vogelbacteria bacterium]|nr:hypothetical protein [Candidatus Vogelbacteria bacterium]